MRLLQRRLCGRETRQRNPVRRAAHIVEPDPVAEFDRTRLATVLAADTEVDLGLRSSSPLDRDPHQVADTLLVERLERVPVEHAFLEVEGEELALRVVAGHAERRLRE